MAITISAAILNLCLRKTRADKSPDYGDVIVFEKRRLKQCVIAFSITFFFFENAKIWVGRTTLNREEKGDGLTGEIKLRFHILPAFLDGALF